MARVLASADEPDPFWLLSLGSYIPLLRDRLALFAQVLLKEPNSIDDNILSQVRYRSETNIMLTTTALADARVLMIGAGELVSKIRHNLEAHGKQCWCRPDTHS